MSGLHVDQTTLTLVDLNYMIFHKCEILKGNISQMDKYLDYGWYEYAKSKKFKVVYLLLFHYRSAPQMFTLGCWDN